MKQTVKGRRGLTNGGLGTGTKPLSEMENLLDDGFIFFSSLPSYQNVTTELRGHNFILTSTVSFRSIAEILLILG